jgi:indolepyruvate ferredoxin oxidoreductase alpha subunit
MSKDNKAFQFLLGNEAIARAALEAGVDVAAGYPGTPSSEIVGALSQEAKAHHLHVEWSTNEKVATEVAAAAAFAGLRSLAPMKNAGLSVALDFLTHLSYTGIGDAGGAMIVVVCDDPDAHSSGDETDSRWLAKFAGAPLLEPSSIHELGEMMKWAFDLSEEFNCYVMVRSYTRLSHASSAVKVREVPKARREAHLDTSQTISPYLARPHHAALVELLSLQDSVGILKLGTLWPFPEKLVQDHARRTEKILVVEEVDPFIEIHVKESLADANLEAKAVYGKGSGHIPGYGEMTTDRACEALAEIFRLEYQPRTPEYREPLAEEVGSLLIDRGLTWCPGCPHRASFWALERAVKADGRDIYVTGDIGCYTLDVFPDGKGQVKLLHAMGSGTGLAAGFGQLGKFNSKHPIIAICGDSTFFHASIPALINAVYNKSNMIQIVLDNGATAMTGFQPHPGTGFNAVGDATNRIDLEELCRSLGCTVAVCDPFDVRRTVKKTRELLKQEEGVRVLIMRRTCELVRMRQERGMPFVVRVQDDKCRGEECSVCSRDFRCPGLAQDLVTGKAMIKEDMCCGCGVCFDICPFNAITREEVNR